MSGRKAAASWWKPTVSGRQKIDMRFLEFDCLSREDCCLPPGEWTEMVIEWTETSNEWTTTFREWTTSHREWTKRHCEWTMKK